MVVKMRPFDFLVTYKNFPDLLETFVEATPVKWCCRWPHSVRPKVEARRDPGREREGRRSGLWGPVARGAGADAVIHPMYVLSQQAAGAGRARLGQAGPIPYAGQAATRANQPGQPDGHTRIWADYCRSSRG